MQLATDHVRVRVPATSANLGPGFDALGLALGLHDEVEVRLLGSADVAVDVEGEGAGEVPGDDTHLVVRALRVGLEAAGAPQTGLHLRARNAVPHGRGLGSSAAAVVAGLVAARGLVADPGVLDDETVLGLATELEGHPDNAAPALLGGATVAWLPRPGEPAHDAGVVARAVGVPVHPELVVHALVPTTRLSTHRARGVLPTHVPHADAAANAGRSALLVEALGRRPDLLLEATADLLHQRYRAPEMPASGRLVDHLRAQGVAAVVSGAGPTVLVLGAAADRGRTDALLAAAVAREPDAHVAWRVLELPVDRRGAVVERLGGR